MKKVLIVMIFVLGMIFCSGYGCATAFADGFNRGYNNAQGNRYEPEPVQKADCAFCHGIGLRDCISCNGTGYGYGGYKCYQCTKGLVKCFSCHGSGKAN